MTVLVTGANGFIGAAVVERLLREDAGEVRALSRPGSDQRRLAAALSRVPRRARLCSGTLDSVDAAAHAMEGADTVIHLAAALRGAPAELFANTVVTSQKLVQAALRRLSPPKLVLVSSLAVYRVARLLPGAVVDERTPLETRPERRDAYAFAKIWQDRLFREAANDLPLVILRPGVVYGADRTPLSARVGIARGGWYLHLGGDNPVPLTYVDNCADAIVLAASAPDAVGEAFNVIDHHPPTARELCERHRCEVADMRTVSVPYPLLMAGSWLLERYHRHSQGQLPAVFTPYKTASLWKRQRFDNAKLGRLGWHQRVSTEEGLDRAFTALRRSRC